MSEQQEHSSPIEFPCDFTIKIMGKNDDLFQETVKALVFEQFPSATNDDITTRPSKGDAYLALTVKVHATSKQQLDALYQALSDCPQVIMAL